MHPFTFERPALGFAGRASRRRLLAMASGIFALAPQWRKRKGGIAGGSSAEGVHGVR